MIYFDDIRKFLLDPANASAEQRKQAYFDAGGIKIISGLVGVAAAMLTVSSLITMLTMPLFGSFGFFISGITALSSRELFVITGNVENLLKDPDSFFSLSILNRLTKSFNATSFVNAVYKNTWVVGPIFSTYAINMLESDKE